MTIEQKGPGGVSTSFGRRATNLPIYRGKAVPSQSSTGVIDVVSNTTKLAQVGQNLSTGAEMIWWPMNENIATLSGSITVADITGQISGVITGGVRRFGPWPGVMGDGATRILMNGGAQAGFTTTARRCGDLSTLKKNEDQITIWGIVNHGTNLTGGDRAIISYGATQSAKGGWSFGFGGSRERFYSVIAPKNNTTIAACRTEYPGDKLSGSAITPTPPVLNSVTAFAIELMADTTGYLISNLYVMPLSVDFGIDMKLQSYNSLALVPAGSGGTAAATHDVDAPFCIGARPTTNSSTFTDNMNNISIGQVGIVRHRWDQGIGARIVRDLRNSQNNLPNSLAVLLGS